MSESVPLVGADEARRLRGIYEGCPGNVNRRVASLAFTVEVQAWRIAELEAALEQAVPWLDYLADHVAEDWSPPEAAVVDGDRSFIRAALGGRLMPDPMGERGAPGPTGHDPDGETER